MERDWAQDRGRLVGQLMPIGASSKPQPSHPASQIRNETAPLLLQGVNGKMKFDLANTSSEVSAGARKTAYSRCDTV